jgi:hypothetical protein
MPGPAMTPAALPSPPYGHGGRRKARQSIPQAEYLLLLADGGGSNGSRRRQWKYELYGLSKEIGILIRVCHYPPGTSKWNKIEHCLFPFISMNWRGVPLHCQQVKKMGIIRLRQQFDL